MTNSKMNYCTKRELIYHAKLNNSYITDKVLNKATSNSILNNVCAWCEYASVCNTEAKDNTKKVCIWKSTESHRVWIQITPTRPKVVIGKTYGKITPISLKNKDEHGNLYYECIVKSKGNKRKEIKIIRSQEILRGNAVVLLREKNRIKKYNIGSQNNPDGTKHVYPSEHHTKVGQAVDELVIEEKESENGPITLKYHRKTLCDECKGIVRINQHGEAECERCHLIC